MEKIAELEQKVNELFSKVQSLEQQINDMKDHNDYNGVYLGGVNPYNRDYISKRLGEKEDK